jgi:hypothetical protein
MLGKNNVVKIAALTIVCALVSLASNSNGQQQKEQPITLPDGN